MKYRTSIVAAVLLVVTAFGAGCSHSSQHAANTAPLNPSGSPNAMVSGPPAPTPQMSPAQRQGIEEQQARIQQIIQIEKQRAADAQKNPPK